MNLSEHLPKLSEDREEKFWQVLTIATLAAILCWYIYTVVDVARTEDIGNAIQYFFECLAGGVFFLWATNRLEKWAQKRRSRDQ